MASRRRKIVIFGGLFVVIGGVAAAQLAGGGDRGVEARLEEVATRDLVATVTASGQIEPKRSVQVSPDITGRIVSLPVQEGEWVRRGQVLVRIDPTQFEAALQRAEAMLASARAAELQARVNRDQALRALNRALDLQTRDSILISPTELETAQTNFEVAEAVLESQGYQVAQAEASVRESEEQLSKTTVVATMDGRITRLDVEEGEVALASTFSRDTGRLMTIADLSIILVKVRVDETDVVRLADGDSAAIEIDAFPDTTFTGRVTRISQSAIQAAAAGGSGTDRAVDYDVEITIDDPPTDIRPDLSATARIITDTRQGALSIPIIALTVREHRPISTENAPRDTTLVETEGVFVIEGGVAQFRPVVVGIAGEEHFEVISGISLGDSIVAGPYQTIRDLADSTVVRTARAADDAPDRGNGA